MDHFGYKGVSTMIRTCNAVLWCNLVVVWGVWAMVDAFSASLVRLSERFSPCLPPLPRRDWCSVSPQSQTSSSCPSFQLFKDYIPRRILPVPPAPAVFD